MIKAPMHMGAFLVQYSIFAALAHGKIIVIALTLAMLFVFAVSCKPEKNTGIYSYNDKGYYYHLLSFDSETPPPSQKRIVWVAASFCTQGDSVFWDSYNNLNDRFYLESDSIEPDNFFKDYISICSEQDSACLLVKPADFFRQQFRTKQVPFFCTGDSVVKINFKVKRVLGKEEFIKVKHDLMAREEALIKRYFGTEEEKNAARASEGFYWVERIDGPGRRYAEPGDEVTIAYKAWYVNGRFLESSGTGFEFIYGTPDQVLPGLNYAIGHLKLGDNAKIILPSHLAFGENGSSNGTVPPYTPLVYEIKLTDLKTHDAAH